MLSIGKISGGREHYYTNEIATTREDYYTAQKMSFEPAGVWIGEGARRVGIAGNQVIREELRELLRGYTPDGQTALVQNAGKFDGTERDRMPGFDLTFSAPKSVSICWAIGSEEVKKGVEQAQQEAVRKCVEQGFESHIVIRFGKGGTQREPAGLIVGVVQHVTARQTDKQTMPDMQLHSHTMVINTGITKSGKSGAVKGYDFYQMQKDYDARYKAELGKGLMGMGFKLRQTQHGFEIEGVPETVIAHFSKRSHQIDDKTPRDTSNAMERMIANLSTREVKGDIDEQALQRNWNKEAMKLGFTRGTVEQLRAEKVRYNEREEARASVREATVNLTSEKATFTKAELVKETIKAGMGRGVGSAKAESEVQEFLDKKAVKLDGGKGREESFTTEQKRGQAEKTGAERRAEERKTGDGLKAIKRDAQKEGYKVFAVTRDEKRAREQTKKGLQTYTSGRILSDFGREYHEKQAGGRDNVRAKRTLLEKVTLKQNSSRNERRTIAKWKQFTGQMDEKTAKRYSGDYWKPTSKAYHAFLLATGQCTKGEHDSLNRELERQARTVDGKTVVFIGKEAGIRQADRAKLIEQVQARGGHVIIGDPKDFKPGEVKAMLRSGGTLHAKIATQKETVKTKLHFQDKRKEQEQEHEKERTR